jgi:transcriptional regulator with XRE-family HTH domain
MTPNRKYAEKPFLNSPRPADEETFEGQRANNMFIERKKRGWSQKQMADMIGTTQATYSRIETGVVKHPKDKELLQKIAAIRGISEDKLFGKVRIRTGVKERKILRQKEAEREDLTSELDVWINYLTEYKTRIVAYDLKTMDRGLMSKAADELRNLKRYARVKSEALDKEIYRLIFPNDS